MRPALIWDQEKPFFEITFGNGGPWKREVVCFSTSTCFQVIRLLPCSWPLSFLAPCCKLQVADDCANCLVWWDFIDFLLPPWWENQFRYLPLHWTGPVALSNGRTLPNSQVFLISSIQLQSFKLMSQSFLPLAWFSITKYSDLTAQLPIRLEVALQVAFPSESKEALWTEAWWLGIDLEGTSTTADHAQGWNSPWKSCCWTAKEVQQDGSRMP